MFRKELYGSHFSSRMFQARLSPLSSPGGMRLRNMMQNYDSCSWPLETSSPISSVRRCLVSNCLEQFHVFGKFFCWIYFIVALFPTQDAPHYKYAYQILCMFGVLAIVGTYLLDYLYQKELWVNHRITSSKLGSLQYTATKKTRVTESGVVVIDWSDEDGEEVTTLPTWSQISQQDITLGNWKQNREHNCWLSEIRELVLIMQEETDWTGT